MGLARELSMGPRKKRSRVGFEGDFGKLRRLTAKTDPDIAEFKATLDRVAATPNRMRFAEGAAYNDACKRYSELTGEPYGSPTGTY